MQHDSARCQLPHPRAGDSSLNFPRPADLNTRSFERMCEDGGTGRGVGLRVDAAHQWVETTAGRIATCPYSWMQAVHWVGGSGLYAPSRKHGPKWGSTTVQLAQELSPLKECRPGIAYLARKLKVSERTVQYHLDMLREAGLLAYRSVGTRIGRGVRRASHFERMIPAAFDKALGIRTMLRDETAPAYTRVPVGAAAEHRSLLGKLAKKAARKVRRRRRTKKSRSSQRHCTPMQVGTSATTAGPITHVPSEEKLASGDVKSPTQKKSIRGSRKPNNVRRRFQLAAELIACVPWLKGAARDRIAWISKDVADCGWTAAEVQAVAEEAGPLLAGDVRRASGMLAHRLKGVTLLYPTAAHRQTAVKAWEDSLLQLRARHDGWDQVAGVRTPTGHRARQLLREAFAHGSENAADCPDTFTVTAATSDHVDLEALGAEYIREARIAAARQPSLILDAMDTGLSERDARRLYTNRLVEQALAENRRRVLEPAF